ncbi:diaminopropionate ammonia-lyase [Shivajiella indica]|uniref:Diaminopropionate ammonia-lyase n=1 Tax=Shivajiella indica TaxID=872115 RepID=A0ABW5B6B5_9BACT
MENYFINYPKNTISSNLTTEILTASRAIEYHKTLPLYQPTPLVSLPNLAQKYYVGNIYVKDESHRFGLNAFKGLGASYAIHKILEVQPHIEVFCTATDGNHGRAVAWASKIAHKKAIIFVPRDTTDNRINAIKYEGAQVIKVDGNYDETCAMAKEMSKKEGWKLVQDTAWENYEEIPAQIMAGYLTHFQELEDNLHCLPKPKIDIVFLQAGVGSWAGSGIWYYLNRYGSNHPKIIVIEPWESDGILASFKAGKRVIPNCTFNTIMAGLNCGIPSLSAWDIIQSGTDISIKIKDKFAEHAMRELYYPNGNDKRIIAGESGAAGLAGFFAIMTSGDLQLLKEKLEINPTTNILFYNTEGATDLDSFNKIMNQ